MSSIVYLRNRKSNTIYAYLNESVWDESKGRNVYKRRCIGHVDPETGEIVPNRGGRTREYPVVKSRHLCDVFDSVAEGMKLTEALKLSFPDEWKKIMGIVYYLAATGGEMVFCKQWSEQHRTPYGQVITPAAMNELLSDINSNSISLFFTLWRIRLQPEETHLTTIGFGEARSSTSEYSKDLGIDLGALTDKVKMEIFFSTKDNIPICYKLSDKSTGRRLGDYDVSAGSFSRLSFFMDEVTGNPLDPSLVAYADSNLTVRVRPDSEFISGLLEKASATITNPENYRIYLGTPLFSETFMQHINGRKFYTHIFYDPNKSAEDLSTFISMINLCRYEVEMDRMVEEHAGLYERYLIIKEDERGDRTVELNSEAIMHHNKYLGYTVLISNSTRSAATAITPFLQRGKVARRFESMRNEYDSTALNLFTENNYLSRIFLQFLALAIRLQVEGIMDSRKLNRSMTYKEVVRELDNIKTVNIPGLKKPQSTFITDTQARILNAFGIPYGDRSPTQASARARYIYSGSTHPRGQR